MDRPDTAAASAPPRAGRSVALDALRGLVIVLMVVDHARDYVTTLLAPEDLATTTPALFFTRWITHFCAPAFVFLAGTSAWLYGARGRTRAELSRFLATRGLWLVVLELTVVNFAWLHGGTLVFWGVIAAIGVGMLALAALVHLPRPALVAVALALVLGQDVYALIGAGLEGRALDVWRFLHGGMLRPSFGLVRVGPFLVLAIYPVLVWVGVMALGYAIGPWTALPSEERRRRLVRAGLALIAAFLVVRGLDGPGNTRHWEVQSDPARSVMAFLACEKYPPSAAFLAMTLGPAALIYALLERRPGAPARWLATFGRVPLFFYVLHLFVLHVGARLLFLVRDGEAVSIMRSQFWWMHSAGLGNEGFRPLPEGFVGLPLPWVYVASAVVVGLLYRPCRWYGEFKRGRGGLWSYL